MKTPNQFYGEHAAPRRLAPLAICVTIMAAAANAAPVHSVLGVDAANDAGLVTHRTLFEATPTFFALDEQAQWLPMPAPAEIEKEETAQPSQGFLVVPEAAMSDQLLDPLPMLLWALEDERVDSAMSYLGLPPMAPHTMVAGHA